MEDKALSELLNEFDRKLSESILVNTQSLSELKTKKSFSQLKKLRLNRLIEMMIALVLSIFLGSFMYLSLKLIILGWFISPLLY